MEASSVMLLVEVRLIVEVLGYLRVVLGAILGGAMGRVSTRTCRMGRRSVLRLPAMVDHWMEGAAVGRVPVSLTVLMRRLL